MPLFTVKGIIRAVFLQNISEIKRLRICLIRCQTAPSCEVTELRDEMLLERLTQLWGVSGYESGVRREIEKIVGPWADEMWTDNIGNLIVLKKGRGGPHAKKIMYSAHMDQIGFMVKAIEENGLLKICNMGWNWAGAAYNERVIFRNGMTGVVGCFGSIEEAGNKIEKLFVDIGACSREDAKKYVQIGDCCTYEGSYRPMKNNRIAAVALDDRLGVYQMIEALKENDGSYPNDCYYCFVVQEEVGTRGSLVAVHQVNPDIGIAVDISPAHDYPNDLTGSNAVGEGIAVKICDPSSISDEGVVAVMEELCGKNHISYQREVIDRGGTDAGSMNLNGSGVKTGGICVVTRYPHSQSCVVSKDDVEGGIDLMNAFSAYEFPENFQ